MTDILNPELIALLFGVAVVAGALDTLAGGGGLITIPALLLTGLPPLQVLGTNKLQGSVGTGTATLVLLKKNRLQWHHIRSLMLLAFVGSALGTLAVQWINTDLLSSVIPVVLLLIMAYFIFYKVEQHDGSAATSENTYRFGFVPAIGFYDGMFGPGTGSFFSLANVLCRGYKLVEATALAKPLNFATNIASLLVFALAGKIVWTVGLVMMAGQMLGAAMGAHFLFRINPFYLRLLVVMMCSLMLVKYGHSMGWLF